MRLRWQFPVFNGLVGAIAGSVIGNYVRQPILGTLLGLLSGLILGVAFEVGLAWLGGTHWLYQRRVLLAVLVELACAMFPVGPHFYVRAAIRPNHYVVCCETPLDYGAPSFITVYIPTPDGATLAGWYVPPRQRPGPVIVLLPGGRADRRGTAWHAVQLIGAGYGVLMYDPRGLGESSGDNISLGWQYTSDVATAAHYLQTTRPEVDPGRIGVVGLSRGGHLALNAAYQWPHCFAGLWSDGIGVQGWNDYPRPRNATEAFKNIMDAAILKMAEIQLGVPLPPSAVDLLPQMDRPPMVIVEAGRDHYERDLGERLSRIQKPNQQIWLIPNAGHTGGPNVIPKEYGQRMLAFFESAFETSAGKCGSGGFRFAERSQGTDS